MFGEGEGSWSVDTCVPEKVQVARREIEIATRVPCCIEEATCQLLSASIFLNPYTTDPHDSRKYSTRAHIGLICISINRSVQQGVILPRWKDLQSSFSRIPESYSKILNELVAIKIEIVILN